MTRSERSYQTYSREYDKFVAREGENQIRAKLSNTRKYVDQFGRTTNMTEFEHGMEMLRRSGKKNNLARELVSQQRWFTGENAGRTHVKTKHFRQAYERYFGQVEEDFSDASTRHKVFQAYIDERESEGLTHAEAQQAAIDYFY